MATKCNQALYETLHGQPSLPDKFQLNLDPEAERQHFRRQNWCRKAEKPQTHIRPEVRGHTEKAVPQQPSSMCYLLWSVWCVTFAASHRRKNREFKGLLRCCIPAFWDEFRILYICVLLSSKVRKGFFAKGRHLWMWTHASILTIQTGVTHCATCR